MVLKFKTNPIREDYKIGTKVLGVGINGKVVECENRVTGKRFAIKILRDLAKAKREAELHFQACAHPNIVRIFDVYENSYNGIPCLLLIMECMTGGELFTRIQRLRNVRPQISSIPYAQLSVIYTKWESPIEI